MAPPATGPGTLASLFFIILALGRQYGFREKNRQWENFLAYVGLLDCTFWKPRLRWQKFWDSGGCWVVFMIVGRLWPKYYNACVCVRLRASILYTVFFSLYCPVVHIGTVLVIVGVVSWWMTVTYRLTDTKRVLTDALTGSKLTYIRTEWGVYNWFHVWTDDLWARQWVMGWGRRDTRSTVKHLKL